MLELFLKAIIIILILLGIAKLYDKIIQHLEKGDNK